ncbi:MAG: hypothetical protein NVSMB3_04240 [Acidobacteriaceae bacterium]
MALRTHRWALLAAVLSTSLPYANSQVFVVGEKSATADISTDFKATDVQLPSTPLSERGRRELVRNLEAEQGFAHRALPLGAGLTLRANGPLSPGPAQYKEMLYKKGQSAAPGDRVVITAMMIKGDRIILDLNGGPFAKHRFLSHIQFNDNPVVQQPAEQPTGARITLVFEGQVPEISAPEVKALLDPLVDFGVKSSEQAYADTLPPLLKDAIAAHDVLVGMNHRMVLAALGAPESKIREHESGDANGARYEEWIYGHVPQTVRFIRFQADRVSLVEIAELGKPIQIHQTDETGGYNSPTPTREIAMGDPVHKSDDGASTPASAPTLRKPGEALPDAGSDHRVQFPSQPASSTSPRPTPIPPPPAPSNLRASTQP